MQTFDAIVVGGGPGGSTCAWKLRQAGADVLVIDRAVFPRDKCCAGWITPPVLEALALDVAAYRDGRVFQPFTGFRTCRLGRVGRRRAGNGVQESKHGTGALVETRYSAPVSYGIRRCEFDHYLLEHSGARVRAGVPVASLRRVGDMWLVNEEMRAPVLVGAGGHFCPVARHVNGHLRDEPVVAAQEIEFRMTARQEAECRVEAERPELYFYRDLRGYGWCLRKNGVLNIGFGRQDRHHLPSYGREFLAYVRGMQRIPAEVADRWPGHAYLLYGSSPRTPVADGVLLVGDAAGLAYAESGEGIRPAIESGLLAARTILEADGRYDRDRLLGYRDRLKERFTGSSWAGEISKAVPAIAKRSVAGWFLGTRWFTRVILLDRFFLRTQQPPLDETYVATETTRHGEHASVASWLE